MLHSFFFLISIHVSKADERWNEKWRNLIQEEIMKRAHRKY